MEPYSDIHTRVTSNCPSILLLPTGYSVPTFSVLIPINPPRNPARRVTSLVAVPDEDGDLSREGQFYREPPCIFRRPFSGLGMQRPFKPSPQTKRASCNPPPDYSWWWVHESGRLG